MKPHPVPTVLAPLLLAALQGGCIGYSAAQASGDPMAPETIEALVRGRASEADVVLRLGHPSARTRRLFVFDANRDRAVAGPLWLFEAHDTDGQTVGIVFDDERRVKDAIRLGRWPGPGAEKKTEPNP